MFLSLNLFLKNVSVGIYFLVQLQYFLKKVYNIGTMALKAHSARNSKNEKHFTQFQNLFTQLKNISRNSKKTSRNSKNISRNSKKTSRNSKNISRNSKKTSRNSKNISRNSEVYTSNFRNFLLVCVMYFLCFLMCFYVSLSQGVLCYIAAKIFVSPI